MKLPTAIARTAGSREPSRQKGRETFETPNGKEERRLKIPTAERTFQTLVAEARLIFAWLLRLLFPSQIDWLLLVVVVNNFLTSER